MLYKYEILFFSFDCAPFSLSNPLMSMPSSCSFWLEGILLVSMSVISRGSWQSSRWRWPWWVLLGTSCQCWCFPWRRRKTASTTSWWAWPCLTLSSSSWSPWITALPEVPYSQFSIFGIHFVWPQQWILMCSPSLAAGNWQWNIHKVFPEAGLPHQQHLLHLLHLHHGHHGLWKV